MIGGGRRGMLLDGREEHLPHPLPLHARRDVAAGREAHRVVATDGTIRWPNSKRRGPMLAVQGRRRLQGRVRWGGVVAPEAERRGRPRRAVAAMIALLMSPVVVVVVAAGRVAAGRMAAGRVAGGIVRFAPVTRRRRRGLVVAGGAALVGAHATRGVEAVEVGPRRDRPGRARRHVTISTGSPAQGGSIVQPTDAVSPVAMPSRASGEAARRGRLSDPSANGCQTRERIRRQARRNLNALQGSHVAAPCHRFAVVSEAD